METHRLPYRQRQIIEQHLVIAKRHLDLSRYIMPKYSQLDENIKNALELIDSALDILEG